MSKGKGVLDVAEHCRRERDLLSSHGILAIHD